MIVRLTRLLRRRARLAPLTGIFVYQGRDGVGWILPHLEHPHVPVAARTVRLRRLAPGDRVEFEISSRKGHAQRLHVYRRAI